MKERILEFLRAENKSSAQFAEEIGVQPSGISHILSGRNNPSLDFILKMLEKYPFISTDWLLFGKGSMYKDVRMQSLFDNSTSENPEADSKIIKEAANKSETAFKNVENAEPDRNDLIQEKDQTSSIRQIVWFYDDNSFEEYYPRH